MKGGAFMMNRLNNIPKSIKLSHGIFIVFVLLYLIESLFVRGLFTNVYLLLATVLIGFICAIMALVKKRYLLTAIDAIVIIICYLIFNYLLSL